MREEREIAGIALFFTAGVAAGQAFASSCGPADSRLHVAAGMSVIATAALLTATALCSRKAGMNAARDMLILASVLTGGFFCSTSDALHGPVPLATVSRLAKNFSDIVRSHSEAFNGLVSGIPYGDHESAAVIRALITGSQKDISPEVRDAFRDSGASHILALSGMHLALIYAIMLKILAPIGNGPAARKIRSVLIIISSGYYTLLTGASPSLVRAFLFIAMKETAAILGRETKAMGTFSTALMIQLAVAPANICSAGFQLSYLAVAGISLLHPVTKEWYPGPATPMKRIWDAASLTISCQIFTAPAVWLHFGTFPKYFLITNLIAVPLSNCIMTAAVITVLLASAGCCPEMLALACGKATGLLCSILEAISTLP